MYNDQRSPRRDDDDWPSFGAMVAKPSRHPTPPADLTATIYHLLGVDPHMEVRDRLNRPLTLREGQVIDGILT